MIAPKMTIILIVSAESIALTLERLNVSPHSNFWNGYEQMQETKAESAAISWLTIKSAIALLVLRLLFANIEKMESKNPRTRNWKKLTLKLEIKLPMHPAPFGGLLITHKGMESKNLEE